MLLVCLCHTLISYLFFPFYNMFELHIYSTVFNPLRGLPMFRFLAGCATGWMMARAPPTQAELTKAVDRIVVMFALEKYMPQDLPHLPPER